MRYHSHRYLFNPMFHERSTTQNMLFLLYTAGCIKCIESGRKGSGQSIRLFPNYFCVLTNLPMGWAMREKQILNTRICACTNAPVEHLYVHKCSSWRICTRCNPFNSHLCTLRSIFGLDLCAHKSYIYAMNTNQLPYNAVHLIICVSLYCFYCSASACFVSYMKLYLCKKTFCDSYHHNEANPSIHCHVSYSFTVLSSEQPTTVWLTEHHSATMLKQNSRSAVNNTFKYLHNNCSYD